jgi:Xaa-Pro dipeptidase
VILYHTTLFGTTERRQRSVARAEAALRRATAWLGPSDGPASDGPPSDGPASDGPPSDQSGPHGPASEGSASDGPACDRQTRDGPAGDRPAGLVLTGPAAVAWATGGVAPPVDRAASVDLVWAVISPAGAGLITTQVEADRVRAEYDPARHGFGELAEVPWHQPEGFVKAAESLAGAPASRLASDGHPAFGVDASADLVALRLALSPAEQADLADLGADAAEALQSALAQWRPGQRDLDIQARCAAILEAKGADAPVLIVGGDERLERYRHPMAVGAPVHRLVMAVVVARRAGLHAAATRFAAAAPLDPGYVALRRRVLAIEEAVLSASTPGASYGAALDALDAAYARAGAPRGWSGHYQGGPIGFAQREFEIAPGQRGSRWHAEPIMTGHAVAWNPSLPGGAKSEDTYLVSAGGVRQRVSISPGWPTEPDDTMRPPRPAVLEVGT